MARPPSKALGFKCGQIGGGRSKTTGILDVALLPTLARRNQINQLTAGYGFVIVDECHHVAASAFFHVLNRIPARYWLGLTATPERRDGLEDLIYHQLGSHRVVIDPPTAGQLPESATAAPASHPVLHLHKTEFKYTADADPTAPGGMAEIYRALIADQERLDQITSDVLTAHNDGANILVLTNLDRPPPRPNPSTQRRRCNVNHSADVGPLWRFAMSAPILLWPPMIRRRAGQLHDRGLVRHANPTRIFTRTASRSLGGDDASDERWQLEHCGEPSTSSRRNHGLHFGSNTAARLTSCNCGSDLWFVFDSYQVPAERVIGATG